MIKHKIINGLNWIDTESLFNLYSLFNKLCLLLEHLPFTSDFKLLQLLIERAELKLDVKIESGPWRKIKFLQTNLTTIIEYVNGNVLSQSFNQTSLENQS